MKKWTIILTVLVAIETLLIINYVCGTLSVDTNSPSVLISAFGVIITFVVAWQIWQTIASRDEIKEAKGAAEKAKAEVSNIETRLMKEINLAMATSYQQFAMIYRDKELKELGDKGIEKLNLFFSTCYSLKRLIHLSKAQEYRLCDEEIE